MRKRVRNVIGIVIMTAGIVFTMIQLNIPAVRAESCPPGWAVGCGCVFQNSTGYTYDGITYTFCNYMCGGCGGADEPMTIEVQS